MIYDDRQRLSGYGANTTYRYNGRGERVRKTDSASGTTYYHYDEAGHLIAESQSGIPGPVPRHSYVWLDDRPVAAYAHPGAPPTPPYAGQWLHIHTDHLGTPRAITHPNASNATVWRWDFTGSAFGDHAPVTDPDGDGIHFTFNLRFPGQYYDAESGLHYNTARDYEKESGRYVQSDPIGLAGGISTFGYAAQNPLLFSDPLGLAVKRCCRKADIIFGLVDHCWIKTDTITAGMGPSPTQCTQPGGAGGSDVPFSPVYVQPHDCEPTDNCEEQPDVDEDCVNKQLAIGRYLGRFAPWNTCQTFAREVLWKCDKRNPGSIAPPRRTPL